MLSPTCTGFQPNSAASSTPVATEAVRQGMPDQWIEDLTIAGSPEEVAAKIEGFYEIGADSVALFPMPSNQVDRMVQLTADQVLPLLGTRR